jgi:hypothetical protein
MWLQYVVLRAILYMPLTLYCRKSVEVEEMSHGQRNAIYTHWDVSRKVTRVSKIQVNLNKTHQVSFTSFVQERCLTGNQTS